MKLNKNQRKFFHVAVNYFQDNATDVRFKDLKAFAEESNLIIPTSALKNYCQEEGQVRGHYNLLLTGFKPEPISEPEPEFKETEGMIVETPAFVDPVIKKKKTRTVFDIMDLKPLKWHNPIYLSIADNGDVVSINKTLKGAFDAKEHILHDHGNREWKDFEQEIRYRGRAMIDSINSGMWYKVVVMEIKK